MANIKVKWIATTDIGERKVWIVPVCNPSGVVKYVRVSPQIQSGIVEAKYDERGMNPEIAAVQLKAGLADNGWAFIADLCSDADMTAAWHGFAKWIATGPMCIEGAKVKPFPAKYLPPGVHERVAGRADHQLEAEEIVIPELDKAPTSKRKARAAGLDIEG